MENANNVRLYVSNYQGRIRTFNKVQNGTMNNDIGRGTNIKYLPHAFTEKGIYMLMTVLKGGINYERRNK